MRYKLQEAVEVHDILNPAIWTKDGKLHPEVEEQLFKIVDTFVEFCDIPLEVVDAHLVGSNASFNYNSSSDLDLHIVINFELMDASIEILQSALNSQKASFNDHYDITIHGVPVEMYVEDINAGTMSNGIYSLFRKKWVKFPKPIVIDKQFDFNDVVSKWVDRKEAAIEIEDENEIKSLINTAYMIRKNSLAADGEYGEGNLLFKELRSKGIIQELKSELQKIKSKQLSLENMRRLNDKLVLNEDSRMQLISRTNSSSPRGKARFKRRVKSKVANQVKQFNNIDMNKLFKDDILAINLNIKGETNNYLVKVTFNGFLKEIQKKTKNLSNDTITAAMIMQALMTCFNREDVYIHCSCLHPDTKVRLLSGEVITVKEMEARHANGEKMYVYSADSNGDFKPGEVEKVWITGYESDLIKVTLDNGESIITTPNHPYMLRNGAYCIADNLEVGQSLMSMYMSNTANGYDTVKLKITSIEHIHLDEAIPVYDIKVKDWENFTVDAGVILHNCPDFRYRFDYISREKHKTNSQENPDDPQNRPPVKTNPNDTLGSGCKHILLVLSNKSWIIKVASVVNNYIVYMKKHYEKQYADIIYPALFGKKYTEPVQLGIDDIEDNGELATSKDTIDKSNEYGRTRTQFQKGNTQGIRFASKETEDPDQMNLNI